MHGGAPPGGPHAYHLLVAFFDKASGVRISDAVVTASIRGLGHFGQISLPFEPMRIGDATSYGNFVSLPGSDTYRVTVEVLRPGAAAPTHAEFIYRHAVP